jgi:hypothetical protein
VSAPSDAQALAAEKEAVIARIKAYLEPWQRDKRMKVMGEILMREIERIEQEEAEKTARGLRR